MSAKNIPYEGPDSLYALMRHGRDVCKANYDRVFEESPRRCDNTLGGQSESSVGLKEAKMDKARPRR